MSAIAGLVVHARTGRVDAVRALLSTTEGLEAVSEVDGAFAVVLEAERPSAQERLHERLAGHPDVMRADLVFQATNVEES